MEQLSEIPTQLRALFETLAPATGAIYAGVFLFALYGIGKAARSRRLSLPLPPGPPAKWFFEPPFPEKNVAHSLADMTEQYGPVFTIKQGSNAYVIVGRMEAANEIMEKAGGSNVDRPRNVIATELLTTAGRTIMESGGDRFRKIRRAMHTALAPKAVESYQSIQMGNARILILSLLKSPDSFADHIKTYAASVILKVTYGKQTPTSIDSPEVRRIHKLIRLFASLFAPGLYLVQLFPSLKAFHRLGGMDHICNTLDSVGLTWVSRIVGAYGYHMLEWRSLERELAYGQFDKVQKQMTDGTAGPSFTKSVIESRDVHELGRDTMAYLSLGLFGAGSDTTAVALTHAIMIAAAFPDAQARVQAEIDTIIGSERAPTFEDYDDLHELWAWTQELLRFRPVVPIGFSHVVNKDIVYNNYVIPTGAVLLGTHWAISRDPDAFPNPDTFDPQRWLDADGQPRKDMRYFTYGFGRRVCPGQHLANRSIYINLALIFWAFNIVPVPGKDFDLNSWEDGFTSRLPPFSVKFEYRRDAEVIRRALDEFGDETGDSSVE